MVQIDAGTSPDAPPTEQFVDLICADDNLLRSEFAAIIEASWDSIPPTDDDGESGRFDEPPSRRHRPAVASSAAHLLVDRLTALKVDLRKRERSPPLSA